MGYHKLEITKGVLGDFSKITEEYEELSDAVGQKNPVLALIEMSDLIGAIEAYASKYNVTLKELIEMKELTKQAFAEGHRK